MQYNRGLVGAVDTKTSWKLAMALRGVIIEGLKWDAMSMNVLVILHSY